VQIANQNVVSFHYTLTNDPLAGENLHFDVEVTGVRPRDGRRTDARPRG